MIGEVIQDIKPSNQLQNEIAKAIVEVVRSYENEKKLYKMNPEFNAHPNFDTKKDSLKNALKKSFAKYLQSQNINLNINETTPEQLRAISIKLDQIIENGKIEKKDLLEKLQSTATSEQDTEENCYPGPSTEIELGEVDEEEQEKVIHLDQKQIKDLDEISSSYKFLADIIEKFYTTNFEKMCNQINKIIQDKGNVRENGKLKKKVYNIISKITKYIEKLCDAIQGFILGTAAGSAIAYAAQTLGNPSGYVAEIALANMAKKVFNPNLVDNIESSMTIPLTIASIISLGIAGSIFAITNLRKKEPLPDPKEVRLENESNELANIIKRDVKYITKTTKRCKSIGSEIQEVGEFTKKLMDEMQASHNTSIPSVKQKL